MNRALRAATIGCLLIAPVALSSCSAGQIPQTSTQNRDRTGPMAAIGNIYVRQLLLAYPTGGSYAPGDDAELGMSIVNTGTTADELVSISGDGFAGVLVTGIGTAPATPTGLSDRATRSSASGTSASPSGGAQGGSPTPSLGPFGSQTPSAPLSPPPGFGSPATTSVAIGSSVGLPIPANTSLFLGKNAPHIILVHLAGALTPGQSIPVRMTFRDAGTVVVKVLVSAPASYVPNTSTYDFDVPTRASLPGDRAGGGLSPDEGGNG